MKIAEGTQTVPYKFQASHRKYFEMTAETVNKCLGGIKYTLF